MDTESMITELEAERDRLDRAIAALQGSERRSGKKGRRRMSADARKRISDAQKKRWAAQKRSAKS